MDFVKGISGIMDMKNKYDDLTDTFEDARDAFKSMTDNHCNQLVDDLIGEKLRIVIGRKSNWFGRGKTESSSSDLSSFQTILVREVISKLQSWKNKDQDKDDFLNGISPLMSGLVDDVRDILGMSIEAPNECNDDDADKEKARDAVVKVFKFFAAKGSDGKESPLYTLGLYYTQYLKKDVSQYSTLFNEYVSALKEDAIRKVLGELGDVYTDTDPKTQKRHGKPLTEILKVQELTEASELQQVQETLTKARDLPLESIGDIRTILSTITKDDLKKASVSYYKLVTKKGAEITEDEIKQFEQDAEQPVVPEPEPEPESQPQPEPAESAEKTEKQAVNSASPTKDLLSKGIKGMQSLFAGASAAASQTQTQTQTQKTETQKTSTHITAEQIPETYIGAPVVVPIMSMFALMFAVVAVVLH